MRGVRGGSGATLILAAAFLAAGVAGGLGVAFVTGNLPWSEERSTVTVRDVKKLNELSSVEWTQSVPVTEESGGLSPVPEFLKGESVVLIAAGEVRAGVDLEKLEKGDVRVEKDRVTIDLPEPEILSASLDEQKTRVYDRDRGLLDFDPDEGLETRARREAVRKIESSARENGILENAGQNAENSLRAFVKSLGFERVEFE